MEITLICAGIALVATIVSAIVFGVRLHKANKDFRKMTVIHDNTVDVVQDMYEDFVDQVNDRIDNINKIFHDIEDIFDKNREVLDDIIDTIGLWLDADEMLLKRIKKSEDDIDYMWWVMEEHDDALETHDAIIEDHEDILYSIFEDVPEEAEENIDNDKMVEWCCGKIWEDGEYEYFKKVEVTAKKKPEGKLICKDNKKKKSTK